MDDATHCPRCRGAGTLPVFDPCPNCNGRGKLKTSSGRSRGACVACQGKGGLAGGRQPCDRCGGTKEERHG